MLVLRGGVPASLQGNGKVNVSSLRLKVLLSIFLDLFLVHSVYSQGRRDRGVSTPTTLANVLFATHSHSREMAVVVVHFLSGQKSWSFLYRTLRALMKLAFCSNPSKPLKGERSGSVSCSLFPYTFTSLYSPSLFYSRFFIS